MVPTARPRPWPPTTTSMISYCCSRPFKSRLSSRRMACTAVEHGIGNGSTCKWTPRPPSGYKYTIFSLTVFPSTVLYRIICIVSRLVFVFQLRHVFKAGGRFAASRPEHDGDSGLPSILLEVPGGRGMRSPPLHSIGGVAWTLTHSDGLFSLNKSKEFIGVFFPQI